MTRLFQLPIELYWALAPEKRRRSCLFRESCSRHVWRRFEEEGIRAGFAALLRRWRQCRPGYAVVPTSVGRYMILCDGSIIPEDEISLGLRDLSSEGKERSGMQAKQEAAPTRGAATASIRHPLS